MNSQEQKPPLSFPKSTARGHPVEEGSLQFLRMSEDWVGRGKAEVRIGNAVLWIERRDTPGRKG